MDALNRQPSKNVNQRSNAMTSDDATRPLSFNHLPYQIRPSATSSVDLGSNNNANSTPRNQQDISYGFTKQTIYLDFDLPFTHFLAGIGALLHRYNQSHRQHITVFTEFAITDNTGQSSRHITLSLGTRAKTSMAELQEQARKALRKLWPRMEAIDSLEVNETSSDGGSTSDCSNVGVAFQEEGLSDSFKAPKNVDWLFIWPSEARTSRKIVFLAKSGVFHPETINLGAAHLERALLSSQPDRPKTTLSELPILSSQEKSSLLMRACHEAQQAISIKSGLRTHESLRDEIDVVSHFSNIVMERKDMLAVTDNEGKLTLTFEELDQQSTELAKFLHQEYLSHLPAHEKRCAVLLAPHPNVIVTLLAVLKCGATYIPIDSEFPVDRIKSMLDASAAKIMISRTESWQQPTTDCPVVFLDRLKKTSDDLADVQLPTSRPTDLCYIFFTSGTTGTPKGVKGSYHNLIFYLQAAIQAFEMNQDTQMPVIARFTFSISLFELLAPIMAGGSVRMLTRADVLHLPSLAHTLTQVTMAHIGPSLLNSLVTYIQSIDGSTKNQSRLDFSSLHHLSSGGDLVAPTLIESLKGSFPSSELFIVYGCSEIACMGCFYPIPRNLSVKRHLIGKGFDQTDVRVLDKTGNLLPPYCRGEIYISSPGVTLGYLNLPELSQERYIEKDGKRFYRTGDIGQWLWDGNIEFFGRKDYQVQIKGIRVELAEVEVNLKTLPNVKEAASALQNISGQEEPVLVGFLVAKDNEVDFDINAIRCELLKKIPDYLVPSRFVLLETLPLNINMKVDRRALPNAELAICLSANENTEDLDDQLARHSLEKALLLFNKVTGKSLTTKEANTDFSLLGINSLMLMSFRIAIEKQFGISLLLPQLKSSHGTLISIAKHLESLPSQVETSKISHSSSLPNGFFNRNTAQSIIDAKNPSFGKVVLGFTPENKPSWYIKKENTDEWHRLTDSEISEQSHLGIEPAYFRPSFLDYDLESAIPLSSEQLEIWLACQQSKAANAGYNLSFALNFNYPLDEEKIKGALTHVSKRNPTLRSCIFNEAQYIGIQCEAPLHEVFCSVASQKLPSKSVLDESSRPCDQPFFTQAFNLEGRALWRCGWDDSRPSHLWFCFHHLVMDGWSINLFFEQFIDAYQKLLTLSLSDYEVKVDNTYSTLPQANWLSFTCENHQESDKQRALDYWKEVYSQVPEPLDLPSRWPRGSHRSFNADYSIISLTDVPTSIAPSIGQSKINRMDLEQSAAKMNVSVFALCYSAFVSLVHRLSGQEAFSIGVPLAGQPALGFPDVMTHAVRTLPIKHSMPQGSLTEIEASLSSKKQSGSAQPETTQTISEWVKTVALQLDEAYKHGQCSFGELLSELKLTRDASRPPLVSVIFTQTPDQKNYTTDDLKCEIRSVPRNHETFDAWFNVLFEQNDIKLESQFNSNLFDQETVIGWMKLYKEYLAFFINQLSADYSALPSLSISDKKIIDEWNNTQVSFSAPLTLTELLTRQVKKTPSTTAFVFGEQSLTFTEFDEKTSQLSHWLSNHGVCKGHSVGVYAERSMEMLLAIYAVIKTGALYVPLDPNFPVDRRQYMIENSHIKTVFSHGKLAENAIINHSDLNVLDVSQQSEWNHFPSQPPQVTIRPKDSAYIIYTSGSTGRPKGVINTHKGITNRLLWQLNTHQLSSNDRVLFKTPFNFDVSLWEIFCPILNGSPLIIAPPEAHKDPDELENLAVQHGITMMHFVPSMLSIFLKRSSLVEPENLPLRAILCSGEALPLDLQQDFFERYPNVDLHNLYGPTEAAVEVSHWQCSPELLEKAPPIGKPIANTQLHVVDKDLKPQPIGVAGELLIGGVQVAKGYANQAALTAEKFLPDPFLSTTSENTGNPMPKVYRTGDLARWNHDGEIEYLGRLDFQVKIRGLRIEIGEIETLLNLQESINQVVVIVKKGSDGQPQLIAFCTSTPSSNPIDHDKLTLELKNSLLQALPAYMVPNIFQFIDEMPLSASGKADRKQLMSMEIQLNPSVSSLGEPPRNKTETFLVNLWQTLLGTQEKLSRLAEFTELGGHSLLAIQMMAKIKSEYGVKLGFSQITGPLHEIAQLIDNLQTASKSPLPTIVHTSASQSDFISCSLAPEQESVILAALQSPQASAGYNLSNCLEIKGSLSIEAIKASLHALVNRHQALRAHIDTNTLQYQIPKKELSIQLNIHNLDQPNLEEKLIKVRNLRIKHASEPFNFSDKTPLTRFDLIRLADNHHFLLTTFHHAIADGWSKKIFFGELAELYNSGGKIDKAKLSKPIPISDYNSLRQSQEKQIAASIEFWQSELPKDLDILELPLRKKVSNEKTFSAKKVTYKLDESLTQALHASSRKLGQTLFNIALTGYALLMSRMTQTSTFSIGVPFAGQPIEGMDCLIGQCARVLPVVLTLDESLSFAEQVQLTSQKISLVYENSCITFTELSEISNINNSQLAGNIFSLNQGNLITSFNGVEAIHSENPIGYSLFDLGLTVNVSDNEIVLEWIFNTQKYDEYNVRHWLRLYENLMSNVVASSNRPQSTIEWLTVDDLRQIEALNQTQITFPDSSLLTEVFTWSEKTPDATALTDGKIEVSYQELKTNVYAIADLIESYSIQEQDCIAVCMDRTIWVPQIILAIWLTRNTYLPLDPSLPMERLQEIIVDTKASLVFLDNSTSDFKSCHSEYECNAELHEWLREQAIPFASPKHIINNNVINNEKQPKFSHKNNPEDIAYIIFTSGSIGSPKGVAVTHDNLWNLLCYLKPISLLDSGDNGLAIANFSFDPHLFEIMLPLLTGARCIITPNHIIQDSACLGRWIDDHQVHFMQGTPIIWHLLSESGWYPKHTLKTVISGGETLSSEIASVVHRWADHFYNAYGPTETTILSSLTAIKLDRPLIIGQPIANTEVLVMDWKNQPLPIGCEGELWIGGKGVSQGYWRRDESTRAAFITKNGKRWYKTGDKARLLPSNDIEFLGRIDRQIKLRGFRIEPSEIEHCLLKHEAIDQACVVLHSSNASSSSVFKSISESKSTENLGKKNPKPTLKLVAFVCTTKDYKITQSTLKSHVSRHLPSYLIPQHFEIIKELPTLQNGKINRKDLCKYPLNCEKENYSKSSNFLNETEELLSEIWKSILSVDSVDRHDDFFLIGGHSLSAVKVLTQVNNQLGINLSINIFLQNQTLKDLAKLIDSHPEAANQSNAVFLKQGNSTPLFCLYGVLLYKDLANALPNHQTVIGVYLKEEMELLKNEDTKTFLRDYGDMDSIAQKYMRTIKSVQPNGPYYISGESFGGVVALEVARKLLASGNEVKLVAMMDSWRPDKAKQRPIILHILKHIELALKDKGHFTRTLSKTKSQLRYHLDQKITQLKKIIKPFLPFIKEAHKASKDNKLPGSQIDLRQQARNALVKRYMAKHYSGKVLLIRAMERDPFEREDIHMGWSNLIPNINVVHVPGDHLGILQKPNVSEMAKHLSIYLPTK